MKRDNGVDEPVPHQRDRHGVDPGAQVGGQRAPQQQGGGRLAGRADARPAGRRTGVGVGQDGHAGRRREAVRPGADREAGQMLQWRRARRAGHGLLQVGTVGDAAVEGQVDAEVAGRPLGRGDGEGDVEPGLVGRHPRRLGHQDEGRAGGARLLATPPAAVVPRVLTRAATATASVQRAVLARRVDTGRG